ncbi:MAG: hypothetical protein WD512_20065 [Candidatus Paceibacterota bacterium]
MSDIQEGRQFMNYLISGIYAPFLSISFFSKIYDSITDKDLSMFVSKNQNLVGLGILALTTSIGWQTHLYMTRKFDDKQLMDSNPVAAPLIVTCLAIPVGFFHGLVALPFHMGYGMMDFMKNVSLNREDSYEDSALTKFAKKYLN